MKTKINWNEIESKIDLNSVGEKLATLSASGGLHRKKSAGDLLEKVKDALVKARNGGASFSGLTAFLRENGLPVSEPTVREFLRKCGAKSKPRQKPAKQESKQTPAKSARTTKPTAVPPTKTENYMRPLPDGPRIANLDDL